LAGDSERRSQKMNASRASFPQKACCDKAKLKM
jgi:hypothetical protein